MNRDYAQKPLWGLITRVGICRRSFVRSSSFSHRFGTKRKRLPTFLLVAFIYVGNDLRSHTLSRAVPSALRGLTSVFGMGTGVTPAVWSPAICASRGLAADTSAATSVRFYWISAANRLWCQSREGRFARRLSGQKNEDDASRLNSNGSFQLSAFSSQP